MLSFHINHSILGMLRHWQKTRFLSYQNTYVMQPSLPRNGDEQLLLQFLLQIRLNRYLFLF